MAAVSEKHPACGAANCCFQIISGWCHNSSSITCRAHIRARLTAHAQTFVRLKTHQAYKQQY